jgi:membrane protein CcdC involved in cytochrome C biogenesis
MMFYSPVYERGACPFLSSFGVGVIFKYAQIDSAFYSINQKNVMRPKFGE